MVNNALLECFQERDRYFTSERRAVMLQKEKDELTTNLDQADWGLERMRVRVKSVIGGRGK
jgi:hypothetical protein